MRSLIILALTIFACSTLIRADEPAAADSAVVILTDATFDQKLKPEEDWLVEFYAPWCGHCKKLAPTWEELAKSAQGKFHVGKVDCTVEKASCGRFEIRGFPTVKFLKDGKFYDYKDARTVEAFTLFATQGYATATGKDTPAAKPVEEATPAETKPVEASKPAEPKAEPASADGAGDVVILTDASFQSTIDKGVWLVEFYAPWCGHCKRLVPTWEELATAAKKEGKFHVGKVDCTVEKETASKAGVQ